MGAGRNASRGLRYAPSPAIANLLLGVLAGEWLRNRAPNSTTRKVLGMVAVGVVMMLAAVALKRNAAVALPATQRVDAEAQGGGCRADAHQVLHDYASYFATTLKAK